LGKALDKFIPAIELKLLLNDLRNPSITPSLIAPKIFDETFASNPN